MFNLLDVPASRAPAAPDAGRGVIQRKIGAGQDGRTVVNTDQKSAAHGMSYRAQSVGDGWYQLHYRVDEKQRAANPFMQAPAPRVHEDDPRYIVVGAPAAAPHATSVGSGGSGSAGSAAHAVHASSSALADHESEDEDEDESGSGAAHGSGSGYVDLERDRKEQAKQFKKQGRVAKGGAEALAQTRTQEAKESLKSLAKNAAFTTADVFAPGVGSAASGLDAMNETRKDKNAGKGLKKRGAVNMVKMGLSFIPVAGPILSGAEDLYNLAKTIGQSDKSRSADKLAQATAIIEKGEEQLAEIEMALEHYAQDGDHSDEKEVEKLEKARKRIEEAMEEAGKYVKKKEERGTASLLSGEEHDD